MVCVCLGGCKDEKRSLALDHSGVLRWIPVQTADEGDVSPPSAQVKYRSLVATMCTSK